MSAEQIKKSLISIAEELFDLFEVQGFLCKSRKNLALGEQTLCSPSRHSNGCDRQNQRFWQKKRSKNAFSQMPTACRHLFSGHYYKKNNPICKEEILCLPFFCLYFYGSEGFYVQALGLSFTVTYIKSYFFKALAAHIFKR